MAAWTLFVFFLLCGGRDQVTQSHTLHTFVPGNSHRKETCHNDLQQHELLSQTYQPHTFTPFLWFNMSPLSPPHDPMWYVVHPVQLSNGRSSPAANSVHPRFFCWCQLALPSEPIFNMVRPGGHGFGTLHCSFFPVLLK